MKRLLLFILPVIVLATGLSSCSEDFKVDAPYKHITVVYGLLNADSTRNYIRIEKAFLDENKSALVLAQNPDSNYYPDAVLDVHLKEINNGIIIYDEHLSRVNLADEGYPKQSGAFFTDTSYAYKSTRHLNPSYHYRLTIYNSATGERDSAEAPALGGFAIIQLRPTPNQIAFPDDPPTARLDFSTTFTTGDSARYFEGVIRFHYVDKNTATGQETDHSFDYQYGTFDRSDFSNNNGSITIKQAEFYPQFTGNIPQAAANIERYIDSCDIFLYAGSSDLYTYLQANSAQGGLTGDQIRPSYTNIHGSGVVGVFAGRGVSVLHNVPLSPATITALENNSQTHSLNIKGTSDH